MRQYFIHLFSVLAALASVFSCVEVEECADSQVVSVHASLSDGETKATFDQSPSSLDLIAKWKETDKINLYLFQDGKSYKLDPVPVYNISQDGKSCSFDFKLPAGMNQEGPYDIYGLCDAEGEMQTAEAIVLAKSQLKRMPWANRIVPVWFHARGGQVSINATFRHLGTYEILHVTNASQSGITYRHDGFDVDVPWYKSSESTPLRDDYDPTMYVQEPGDDAHSASVSIGAGMTESFLSWYIPSGAPVKDARLVATINGARIVSANEKQSSATIRRGHAYHMYATWDGSSLQFGEAVQGEPVIEVAPKDLAFGDVEIGDSQTKSFIVKNIGKGILTFYIAGGGQAFLCDLADEYSLGAGEQHEVSITFRPPSVAGYGAALRVFSNASNGTQYVECSGKGVESLIPDSEVFTVKGVSFKMLKVEGGSFLMGSPDDDPDAGGIYSDEKPQHRVTLNTFSIGETEVTQALWSAVMGSNPSSFKGDNLPVEEISWYDAQEFIEELSRLTGRPFSLPTEAEWEYAARGGKRSNGYKYAGSDDVHEVAWNCENSDWTTHPVATKKPNELGLYDMSGNVWEWCRDWYDFNYYKESPSDNPCNTTSSSYHIHRGGSVNYVIKDLRVAMRGDYINPPSNNLRGLRLAINYHWSLTPGEYVDLGLPSGTLWASCNVGAQNPQDYGYYFAKSDINPKNDYSEENYTPVESDLVSVLLGSSWATPTSAQFQELDDECVCETKIINGKYVDVLTGPNGNCIGLPKTGYYKGSELYDKEKYGYYWTKTNFWAWWGSLYDDQEVNWSVKYYYGFAYRPVYVGGGGVESPSSPTRQHRDNMVGKKSAGGAAGGRE